LTKRRKSTKRRLKLLIETFPIIVCMKNYKNGLPPLRKRQSFLGGALERGVPPKKICKKIGGGSLFSSFGVLEVFVFKTPERIQRKHISREATITRILQCFKYILVQYILPDEAGSCKAGVRTQVFTLRKEQRKWIFLD